MAVSGNPQLNIRLERDLLESVKQAAEEQGMSPHEWVRRLIKEKLGLVKPLAVDSVSDSNIESRLAQVEGELENIPDPAPEIESLRSEMESLRGEIESLKKSSLSAA